MGKGGPEYLIISGIILLIPGLILTAFGLPSDEAGATIWAGQQINDQIEKTSNSPIVDKIAESNRNTFMILGASLDFLGVVLIVVPIIAEIKKEG